MLNFRYGPDGSVHVIDWYDKNQCHSPNPDVHDKTLGRIFKITHENDKWVQVNLTEMDNQELVDMLLHENEWYVRHARRLLHERGVNRRVANNMKRMLDRTEDRSGRLRVLWALYTTNSITDDELLELLDDEDDIIRSWAIQLIADDKEVSDEAVAKFAQLALTDPSQTVRLYLASALQRVKPYRRWDVLQHLYVHAEDAEDHNLPLMVWYAAEPLIDQDMARALDLALTAELPNLLPYTVRKIAALGTPQSLQVLASKLEEVPTEEQQKEILKGLNLLIGGTE